jgi:hypothetical protein
VKVYISGPYTGGDTIINVRNAIEAGDRIVKAGHNAFVPHLFHFWHYLCPGDYEQWMRLDFEWVGSCEVMLRLPGESSGADREVELAESLGIAVFHGFGAEFWAHLKSGVAVEQRAVFTDVELALERLRGVWGATMTVDGQGDYVVSWRPV